MKTRRAILIFALLRLMVLFGTPLLGCAGRTDSASKDSTTDTAASDGTTTDSTLDAIVSDGTSDAGVIGDSSDDATHDVAPDGTTPKRAPVSLGAAGSFVILSKSGIDTIPDSVITGNIGVSPIDATGITGFSLTYTSESPYSTSTQVIGKVYASDYGVPTPTQLTAAIGAMQTAYTDAAGRTTPDVSELGAGAIGGLTLAPGLYKWGSAVLIATDVVLKGGPTDVWIFQISGTLTIASATSVILSGGALAKNVFWQVADTVALDTTAHIEGIVLAQADITLATGASVNGRLYAQTAVTLDQCTVTQPVQ